MDRASRRDARDATARRYPSVHPYLSIGAARRPFLDVVLFGPDGEVGVSALVDSGAELTVFNSELATIIGVTPRPAPYPVAGFGDVEVELAQVTLEIEGRRILAEVGFHTFDLTTGSPAALLGLDTIFQHFWVAFDHQPEVPARLPEFLLEPY